MKTNNFSKISVFGLVFLIGFLVLALRLIMAGGMGYLREWIRISWFLWGGIVGGVVVFIDRLMDIYITNPETELAIWTKKFVSEKRYGDAVRLIKKNEKLQKKLIFKSILFQAIWIGLCLLTVFSAESFFAKGFILGLGGWLFLSNFETFLKDKEELKTTLFWQINAEISDKILNQYMIFLGIFWLMMFLKTIY